MSGTLSECYIGHEGVITELSMSWVGREGQQLDKPTLLRVTASLILGLILFQTPYLRESRSCGKKHSSVWAKF